MFDLQNPSTKFNIEPSNTNGRQVLAKTSIGLVLGVLIAFLIFLILTFVGSIFTEALAGGGGSLTETNPLLPLILIMIAFVSTFIGNMIVAGLYSLFYSRKYYDSSKMFSFLILSNVIIFFILAPIYIVFNSEIDTLFLVLAFHVFFSIFISHAGLEFISNPNYSASYLVGTVMGFIFCIFLYALIHKYGYVFGDGSQVKLYMMMLFPSVLAYTFIPLWQGIWDVIYYKFYEVWNNFFYIPSLSEVIAEDDINNDANGSTTGSSNDDINVNIG